MLFKCALDSCTQISVGTNPFAEYFLVGENGFKCLSSFQAGVKSFLERFEQRCQEHNQSSDARVGVQSKTPSVTPSVTPNTRLAQARRPPAGNAAAADITLRQKLVG